MLINLSKKGKSPFCPFNYYIASLSKIVLNIFGANFFSFVNEFKLSMLLPRPMHYSRSTPLPTQIISIIVKATNSIHTLIYYFINILNYSLFDPFFGLLII